MSEVTVRALGEEDWEQFRAIRLAALTESPDAFVASVDEERGYDEDFWRLRLRRSTRMVAEHDSAQGASDPGALGVVSLGQAGDEEGRVAEIFGLWVAPQARGTGVATKLVEASADQARREGRTHVAYWVGTDNGRAVAFASGIGFRPTDFRRPMHKAGTDPQTDGSVHGVHDSVDGSADDEQEIAMILPLGDDRGRPISL